MGSEGGNILSFHRPRYPVSLQLWGGCWASTRQRQGGLVAGSRGRIPSLLREDGRERHEG